MPTKTQTRTKGKAAKQPQAPRRTQQERRETTRRLLVDTARTLFARNGYAATSLEDVVSDCGVTKGAFYHHFIGKEELFEAVFLEEQQRISLHLTNTYEARRGRDPVAASLTACRTFLEISRDPAVQRITLLDAPAVLGWEKMRAIESEYGLAMVKDGVRNAIEAGRAKRKRHDVDALGHMLFGALCEGAMYMARADDQKAAQRKVEREFKVLIEGLVT